MILKGSKHIPYVGYIESKIRYPQLGLLHALFNIILCECLLFHCSIKEFQNNPKFVNIMESFRSMFNFEDPDMARAAGREGEARRSIVQQRLRKKLEERRAGKKN